MSLLKIDRFEIVDVDNRGSSKKGIKDHSIDKIVVLLNKIVDEETTVSIAEDIISVIETHLVPSDDNGSED